MSVFSHSSPDFSPRVWKGGASQAAEKSLSAVILSGDGPAGPPIEMKIGSSGYTVAAAWNGEGRPGSGFVEAVPECGLGRALEPIFATPPSRRGTVVSASRCLMSIFRAFYRFHANPSTCRDMRADFPRSPFAVILSAAKDLARSIFKAVRDSSLAVLRTACGPTTPRRVNQTAF